VPKKKPRSVLPPRDQRPLGFVRMRTEHRRIPRTPSRGVTGSFSFDVMFRTVLGVTLGLLVGLNLTARFAPVELSTKQFFAVQFLPTLHFVVVYLQLMGREVMRTRSGVTRRAMIWGLIYGLSLPSLVAWISS
jgi:hypothetical protein